MSCVGQYREDVNTDCRRKCSFVMCDEQVRDLTPEAGGEVGPCAEEAGGLGIGAAVGGAIRLVARMRDGR